MQTGYDHAKTEQKIRAFWENNGIYEKGKENNKGKTKFTYLDGPPYTSGKIHIGHAWGKALRDAVMRYKRRVGFDVWDRAGFDMHGLPTENKVAAKFNFTRKEQIEEYGVEKFQKACREFCRENMNVMIEDFKTMGVWMDFENPYMPITTEFIEGIWAITKKVYDAGRLYKGHKVMTWCPSCATSLSKHELEYTPVEDDSIFVKFRLEDKEDEHLIIWTTTPWTIPFNLAIMVNPELRYVRMKVGNEIWIMAKDLVNIFMNAVAGKSYEIIEEFDGRELVGTRYVHVFANENETYGQLRDEYQHAFTVIPSTEHVDTSSGSGLVHSAPGCGPADYEVAKEYGLPAFNEVDQYGVFSDDMKKLAGFTTRKDDHLIIQHLENTGVLIASNKEEHDYPHCWRCHGPVIFRPTEQWFFKVEDLKDRMVEHNKNIGWVPEAGFNAFEAWLDNIKDNGVTRQRYWGTPVPIWICGSCGEIEVIGNTKELEEKGCNVPEDLHKPWIDEVTFTCQECQGTMERIPDIFDVWIDAGCAGALCFDYPTDMETFNAWYPADLILEGKDQIRGWFNLLMVISTLAFDQPSFRNVYMHGFINDHTGEKMSKSLGNTTNPSEIIEEFGADVLRYYSIGAAKAGYDLNYNPEDVRVRKKNLTILWNLHNLLLDTIENTGITPAEPEGLQLVDTYIISRMNSTLRDITERFDTYHLYEIPDCVEDFYLDLSRTYVQFVREELASGEEKDKQRIVDVLAKCLTATIDMLGPLAPFITEDIYQNLKKPLGLQEESVHLRDWPAYDVNRIDTALEESMQTANRIIQLGLQAREKAQRGVRWPVREVLVEGDGLQEKLEGTIDLITQQLNTKKLSFINEFTEVEYEIKPNYKALGPLCGKDTPEVIEALNAKSAKEIKDALQNDGYATIEVGESSYNVTDEHVQLIRHLPDAYRMATFRGMNVYVDVSTDEELEKEGLMREAVRRTQNLRKEAGLQKKDSVSLVVVTEDTTLRDALSEFKDHFIDRVGAASFEVSESQPDTQHQHVQENTVKGHHFVLYMSTND